MLERGKAKKERKKGRERVGENSHRKEPLEKCDAWKVRVARRECWIRRQMGETRAETERHVPNWRRSLLKHMCQRVGRL